ncbi:tyrosinase family protein [Mesorhizobium sp. M0276]|uniref:tyrosinase family protein n=1 Tax=Mesorhizobium sp. M0276 TaxID=2956928 RepID=UPI00333A9303
MIIRKDAMHLLPTEKKAFTDAVLALKKQPSKFHPSDESRGRYDDFVEVHYNAMMAMMMGHVPNWGHLSAAFGPWHRVYLYHFESELRATSAEAASVALPYWDWTNKPSTAAVFAPDLLGGNGQPADSQVMDGPFAHAAGNWNVVVKDDNTNPDFLTRQFGADQSAPKLPGKTAQNAVMAIGVYDEAPWYDDSRKTAAQRNRADQLFRFRLEYDLHNLVHRYIGGDMALASSPNDPVFWLHHCNLDRLWSYWEQTKGVSAPYAPDSGGPDGQSGDKPLIFAFSNGTPPWLGATKPQDVYHSRAQLQVGYETDRGETRVLADLQSAKVALADMQMPMPAKDMYPLRREFHEASPSAMKMFPLRQEFKANK